MGSSGVGEKQKVAMFSHWLIKSDKIGARLFFSHFMPVLLVPDNG